MGWFIGSSNEIERKKNTRSIIDGVNKIVRRWYDPNRRACLHDSKAMHWGQRFGLHWRPISLSFGLGLAWLVSDESESESEENKFFSKDCKWFEGSISVLDILQVWVGYFTVKRINFQFDLIFLSVCVCVYIYNSSSSKQKIYSSWLKNM